MTGTEHHTQLTTQGERVLPYAPAEESLWWLFRLAGICIGTHMAIFVVIYSAGYKPFHSIEFTDALVHFGLGGITWLFLVLELLLIAAHSIRRKIPRPWILTTLWLGILLFYPTDGICGYIHDISRI